MYAHITAKVELITPKVAQELLEFNDHNRKETTNNTKAIEKALVNGEWLVSGQTIIIAEDGTLMDGQHRLHAVMNTGIDMHHLVCRGVSTDVFSVIDTGKIRNGGDALSIAGHGNSAKLSNLVKMYNGYLAKRISNPVKMSNTQILSDFDKNQDLYMTALEDGVLYRATNNMLTDIQWATLVMALDDLPLGKEYIDSLVNDEYDVISKEIKFIRKSGAGGRTSVARIWVAVFAGYQYLIKDKPLPKRLVTTELLEAKTRAVTIPYPHD